MRRALLEYLCCPADRGALLLTPEEEARDGHILQGRLTCERCGKSYHISSGVPRLLPGSLERPEERTQARFGFEWQWYRRTGDFGREFWDYLKPIEGGDLQGKVVLDAGCGNGRFVLEAGAAGARDVIGVDLSASVDVAFEATRSASNLHIVQASIFDLPVRRPLDVIYSIGVLHHLEDPEAGFRRLIGYVAPGGIIAIWVYSREGNEWFIRWVEPLRRRVTSRLPLGTVKLLALPAAALLSLAAFVVRSSAGSRIRVPLQDYLRFQGQFGFGYLWLTVVDKLTAPTVHYISEREVRRWLDVPILEQQAVSFRNDTGWRAKAAKAR
jgi:SAM-dependent methyltransferase